MNFFFFFSKSFEKDWETDGGCLFKKLSRHDRNHRFLSIIFATLLGRVNVVQKKFREKKKKKKILRGRVSKKKGRER